MGVALSKSHVAAVAAMIHPAGTDYSFVEQDMREWSWHEMVAQLDRPSLEKVVQDGNPTRGLVGCEFRPRRNSSDHGPQSRLIDWDFLLVRSDNSAVRLHPDWKTTNISVFAVEAHAEPDGKRTFRKYKLVGQVDRCESAIM